MAVPISHSCLKLFKFLYYVPTQCTWTWACVSSRVQSHPLLWPLLHCSWPLDFEESCTLWESSLPPLRGTSCKVSGSSCVCHGVQNWLILFRPAGLVKWRMAEEVAMCSLTPLHVTCWLAFYCIIMWNTNVSGSEQNASKFIECEDSLLSKIKKFIAPVHVCNSATIIMYISCVLSVGLCAEVDGSTRAEIWEKLEPRGALKLHGIHLWRHWRNMPFC